LASRPARLAPIALLALAAGVRALVAWRTLMPGRDGATYLWMAERVAEGDLRAALATVFHPLYSLLVGGLLALAPGLDPLRAGQVVGGACAAAAVLPLWSLTQRRFGTEAALATGVLYAVGVWFARFPAECLSEGPFYLLVTLAARALAAGAAGRSGVWAGLAFWTRPEGLAVALAGAAWLWWRRPRERAAAARLTVACAVTSLALPAAYALAGQGFVLTPKAAFNYDVGIGGTPAPVGHYLAHALRMVGDSFESLGYLVVPLIVAGVLLWRRARCGSSGDVAWVLIGAAAAQALVIPMLRSNIRFLSGHGVLLLPFAGLAWTAAAAALARRGRVLPAALAGLILAPDLARLPAARGRDRLVERELGAFLRPRLSATRTLVSDMPRLEFFAGLRPSPPRPLARAELLGRCERPDVGFCALVAPRSAISEADLAALGFVAADLPEPLRRLAAARRVLVYQRP
jgi:hypothetical protein